MASSPAVRALAERLLAIEAATSAGESFPPPAARLSQKLRVYLTRLIGPDGFTSIQKRALFLARADIPSLQTVTIRAEGHLEGIETLSDGGEAATAIIAHMLELLTAFIGESLTLRLMLDAFPDAPNRSIGESEDLS